MSTIAKRIPLDELLEHHKDLADLARSEGFEQYARLLERMHAVVARDREHYETREASAWPPATSSAAH